ncbi:hypothetical protein F5141DRAFT_1067537 [Pisolithus sp. B1]|nr:hypothetical protein F5141DRAFT_1067537 [Pisolithus sp. B1]
MYILANDSCCRCGETQSEWRTKEWMATDRESCWLRQYGWPNLLTADRSLQAATIMTPHKSIMDRLLAVVVRRSNQVTRLWGGPRYYIYAFAMTGKTRRHAVTRSKTNGGYIQAEAPRRYLQTTLMTNARENQFTTSVLAYLCVWVNHTEAERIEKESVIHDAGESQT